MKRLLLPFLLILFVISCQIDKEYSAQDIVDLAIKNSGVSKLENSIVEFDFRDKHYTATRKEGLFELTRSFEQESKSVKDILSNKWFVRTINNSQVSVPDSMAIKYTESVNSVHYFSKLPLGLNDNAVIKKLLPSRIIKGKNYYKIQVTFQKEGGGVDYNDVFIYWFRKDTFELDYLAYTFQVNGGGIRFRAVTKEHIVNGVRFIDYANYKPNSKFTELSMLDMLYEQNKLIKASDINMENINVSF